ncbi:MAG: response regulator [Planctomycetota bacterium]
MKILTVDDSMTARLIVKKTVEGDGHTVVEAADGQQAIDKLAAEAGSGAPVEAVILDWNMPVMNGLECLKKIRADSAYQALKVIMCTTEAEKTSIVTAIQAGANGYVLKPVSPDVLLKALHKAVGAAA